MKFDIQKLAFQNALKVAMSYTDKRSEMDTDKVQVGAKDDMLFIRGTNNIEDSISYIDCDIVNEGEFFINPSELIKGLAQLKDEIITVLVNTRVSINSGQKRMFFKVSTADSFPKWNESETSQINFNAETGDSIYYLSQFLGTNTTHEFKKCIWISDGYLCAATENTSALAYFKDVVDSSYSYLIPKICAKELADSITFRKQIKIGETEIKMANNVAMYKCKLINDKIPNFLRIVECVNGEKIKLNKKSLLEAIEFSTISDAYIKLEFKNNSIAVSSNGVDETNGSSSEFKIDNDVCGSFSCNSTALKYFLKFSKEENIWFTLPKEGLPSLFEDKISGLVLMPTIRA